MSLGENCLGSQGESIRLTLERAGGPKNQSGLPSKQLEVVACVMHVIPDEITHLEWLSPALECWDLLN